MTHTDSPLAIIVLAAGAGTRMRSTIPKPLHAVGGLSLLGHVLALARGAGPERLVVVAGQGFGAVAAEVGARSPEAQVVEQAERLGTGHAVRCAAPALEGFAGEVLVLYADTPLLRAETVARLRATLAGAAGQGAAAVGVLGFEPADPGGYGRLILEGEGGLARIVEAKDATAEERAVRLCNSGVMAFRWPEAQPWLDGPVERQRQGRILPDRPRGGGAGGRRSRRGGALPRGRDPRRQRPHRPRGGGGRVPAPGAGAAMAAGPRWSRRRRCSSPMTRFWDRTSPSDRMSCSGQG
jgi:CTP:molybdopterin cytidylyltransferase MocA